MTDPRRRAAKGKPQQPSRQALGIDIQKLGRVNRKRGFVQVLVTGGKPAVVFCASRASEHKPNGGVNRICTCCAQEVFIKRRDLVSNALTGMLPMPLLA